MQYTIYRKKSGCGHRGGRVREKYSGKGHSFSGTIANALRTTG